jgi:hypothetical protein
MPTYYKPGSEPRPGALELANSGARLLFYWLAFVLALGSIGLVIAHLVDR